MVWYRQETHVHTNMEGMQWNDHWHDYGHRNIGHKSRQQGLLASMLEHTANGTAIPRPSSIQLLCEAFEVSSFDLGFHLDETGGENGHPPVLQIEEGAKAMQSNKHYMDALVAYTTMKAVWPGEQRIKQLREYTTHW